MFSSGIGTYLQNLIPRLDKQFDILLLVKDCDKKRIRRIFSGSLQAMNASIYTINEQLSYPFCIPSCDLFWSPHYNVPFFPILAKKRAVTIHDVCHLAVKEGFSSIKRYCAFSLLKKAVTKSDIILTVSEFSRKEIVKYLSVEPERIYCVPNAVEKREEKAFCDVNRLGVVEPFILYVGNGKLHKNVKSLCKAFSLLGEQYRLVWVNPESDFSAAEGFPRVEKLSNISREDLNTLYAKAALLVHPSLYEGFGLTPLEAMNMGCPTVVSHVAALPEVCGKAAKYINPYDERSLYQGMKEVLENEILRKDLIKAGYERVKEFSWDKAAQMIGELFMKEVSK